MSVLETAAKFILTPMITAEKPVRLDHSRQALLANWAAKTTIMFEQVQTGPRAIPHAQHDYFGHHHRHPPRVEVWIGARSRGTLTRYDFQGIGGQSRSSDGPDGYGAMLGIGGVFFYLLSLPSVVGGNPIAATQIRLKPVGQLRSSMIRIAPREAKVVRFPLPVPLNDRNLNELFAGLTGRGNPSA